MNFDKIRNLFGFSSANLQRRLSTTPYGIVPIRSVSGQTVTPESALTHFAVYQAVYVLASGVASVDYSVVNYLPNGAKVRDKSNPIDDLINIEPNSDITARAMFESIMVCLLVYGNAYLLISRNDFLEPVALYILDPRLVKYSRNTETYALEYIVSGEVLQANDVIHIAAPGLDAINGFQPLNHLSNVVGVAQALEDFAGSFFANGCNARGILNCKTELSESAVINLRKSMEAVHSGPGRGNTLMVLEEGMEFTPTSINPNECQMTESQKLQILKIGIAFNLPPIKMGLFDNTALNTLEEINQDFFNASLFPWVDRIVQAMNKKLFTKDERKYKGIEYDEGSTFKGRLQDRVNTWQTLKNMGVLSTNEVRSNLGLPPIPNGDVYMVQSNNFTPLDQVVNKEDLSQTQ